MSQQIFSRLTYFIRLHIQRHDMICLSWVTLDLHLYSMMLITWMEQNLECFHCVTRYINNIFLNFLLSTLRCCKHFLGILGETSLHSTWCKSWRCCGISGKPILFAVELGRIFFIFKWLKHELYKSICFFHFVHIRQTRMQSRIIW